MHVDPASPLTLKMRTAAFGPRERLPARHGDESFDLSPKHQRQSFESPMQRPWGPNYKQSVAPSPRVLWFTTRRFLLSLDGLALAVFALLAWRYLLFPSRDIDVSGMQAKASTDSYFLDLWVKHVTDHPIRARDRTGFSEMGLRTSMYAHLLADPSLPDFEEYERKLWPFIPGIASLRKSYFEGARYASEKRPKTRGIVMSLGKNDFDFAIQYISIIRDHYRSNIPIELYYYGEDDLPPHMRHYLTTEFPNVSTVDLEALGFFDENLTQLKRQGFALKPFALVATNFTEVMLADADAVLLASPEEFFEQKGFKETGTLFFHDRDHVRAGAAAIIHEFMNSNLEARGPSERLAKSAFWQRKGIYEQESGIVVVDKSRMEVFAALLFSAWQNTGEVRRRTTYRIFWGDKETFWLAFELAGFQYFFVKHYAGAIGREHAAHAEGFCSEHPFHVFDAPGTIISDGSHAASNLTQAKAEAEAAASALLMADVENQDPKSTAVQLARKEARKVKPAWFNGSLLELKKISRELYISPTAWAIDGQWEFLEDSELWCLRNYTAMPMSEHGLDRNIQQLISTGTRGLARSNAAMSRGEFAPRGEEFDIPA
ncbi:hypothetical protein IE81DRAFT_322392 [Ceraceosorus guamensis]|uniref:Nucleotide-diphospho-sugar transferase n=1 Tax=Ceraceosorus guamensis TaxID=1522189 RepID=A0A316W7B6_9BASI|nr:hypothetical protein IE81DRAFT_322392 [Ceraceosorus guamensis]PWN43535.1 hypothetical protein IE81DRAFT_322392 [Ceraceosorus guamensis]